MCLSHLKREVVVDPREHRWIVVDVRHGYRHLDCGRQRRVSIIRGQHSQRIVGNLWEGERPRGVRGVK